MPVSTIFQLMLRSGVLVLSTESIGSVYTDEAYQNDIDIGARVEHFSDGSSARVFFPHIAELGPNVSSGYINLDNGWAFATGGVAGALDEVYRLGAHVKTGCCVKSLEFDATGRVGGAQLVSGEILRADVVVIAAGSWTSSTFSAAVGDTLLATG